MPDNNSSVASQLNFYVDGPAVIYFGAQSCSPSGYTSISSGNGTLLGFTDGGVSINYQTMTHRINGDEYGGAEGMPAEQLILGGQASIRATIVKWNQGAFERIMCGANQMSPQDGTIPLIAKPYFGSQYGFSFWVVGLGNTDAYWFPKCELATQPKTWNVSSLEKRMNLSVQAYSVLSNSLNAAITYYTGTESGLTYTDCAAVFETTLAAGTGS